jgi:TonB-linked SusC/RagA family outer membrane protein
MIGKPSLRCLMVFLLLLNCTYLIAQERVVTGKIKDPSGNPLPGVNVNVYGTRVSVTADVAGTFRIPVSSENSVLVFTFVGFLQKEVKVGNETDVTVSMTYDNADLDQVVVVGYGTSKRRDLTGAVYSIKPGTVTATPVANAAEALQGRIPGLDINRTSGAPGQGVSIQLRGNRTLSGTSNGVTGQTSEPLVIIDGFQGGNLSDLNPNDIESIEVMKDASSTAIYGWQGANGVILVTTKRGKDRPKVSYSGFYGFNSLKYPKTRTGQELIQFRKDAWEGKDPTAIPNDEGVFSTDELKWYKENKWVDWLDLLTRNGIEQSHTASIQSGGDKTKVYFSAGIYKQEGVLRGTDNTRYNTRLNYDQRISNVFKAGFMTQLTYTNNNGRTDPFSRVNGFVPLGQPYDSVGNIRLFPTIADNNVVSTDKNLLSPLTDERANAYVNNTKRGNILANGYLEITPTTGLSFRSNVGITLGYSRQGTMYDANTIQNFSSGRGITAAMNSGFSRFISWDNILTYTKRFGDHNVTLTGITNYTRSDVEAFEENGQKLILTNWSFYGLENSDATSRVTNSDFTRTVTISYAGRLNYTYKGKYLLTGTLRTDGVSRLAPGNKWDYFPSVGLGWNMHQEDFMKGAYWLNNLKLRATYGVAGNASVQPYATQTLLQTQNAVIGSVIVPTSYFKSTLGNPTLSWEKSATINIGLDFAILRSKIYGSFEVYKTKTTDILFKRPLPLNSGFSEIWENIGDSENEGIEAALTSVNMNSGAFKWTTTLTFTAAREKITRLLTEKNLIQAETNSLFVGKPIKSFYNYTKTGIWQTDENKDNVKFGNYVYKAGDIKVKDHNDDGVIDGVNDRGYIGSDVPKWYGGLQNTFTYKGFELSAYIVARYGQMINADFLAARYNVGGGGNGLAGFDYWTPRNPTNDFPQPRLNSSYSAEPGYTGYLALNMVDGSFFKLKTVTVAYSLPSPISRKVYSDKIRLYVTGNNILTKTKSRLLKNYDPEAGGTENAPITRQFVFGANIDF